MQLAFMVGPVLVKKEIVVHLISIILLRGLFSKKKKTIDQLLILK